MTENDSNAEVVALKLVGISDKDREKFESILTIAENRLDACWQVVDTENNDFFLVSHRLRPQMDQNALLKSLPRECCIFYVTSETDSVENELLISNDGMPSLRSLVMLFNSLSANKTQASVLPEVVEIKPANKVTPVPYFTYSKSSSNPDKEIYFDPDAGFVGVLLSNKAGYYRISLVINGKSASLYIDFEKQKYFSDTKLEDLNPFFSSTEQRELVTQAEFTKNLSLLGLKLYPLDHLIWYAVFSSSQGRARKGYHDTDIVHLKRWPDINLPGCRELIKLAAYMQSNATELNVAQQKTGFSMAQIYNFYNACHAIGLVVHTQQADIHDKKLNDEKRDLFLQIGRRLNKPKQS